MVNFFKITLIFVVILFITSCHSFTRYALPGNKKPYEGTRVIFGPTNYGADYELTTGEFTGILIFRTLDFPFTFVGDTILYPVIKLATFMATDDEEKARVKKKKRKKEK